MSTFQSVRKAIAGQPQGAVFSCADFLLLGTRAAIDRALFRLMNEGAIVRLARGLYAGAGQLVNAETLANALSRKTGEHIELIPGEGTGGVLVVPTSGSSRSLSVAGHALKFQRMGPRKVQLAASPKGRVLLSLWTKGVKNLTILDIQHATADWPEGEVDNFAGLMPAWLSNAIKQATSSSKSVKIGLSGAYDWSNPNIRDDVLIAKVLEKHKFEDVARLCLYYSVPKVKRVFKRREFDPMTTASVTRMLSNISKGLRRAKAHEHA